MPKLNQILKAAILSLTALLCVPVYAQDKRRVAVLEPEGNEVVTAMNKANVRGALTEIIVNTGTYTAVARSHTDHILKEHGFQRGELSDPSKAKELGKLLGADLICVTELLREGGEFNIECSIIDVETGEITNSASEFLGNDSNAAIRRAAEELVRRMFRMGDSWAASDQMAQAQGQAQKREITPLNQIREAKAAINYYGIQLGALIPQGELADGASVGFGLTAHMERVWNSGWALRGRLDYTQFGEKAYSQDNGYGNTTTRYQARQEGVMLDVIYYMNHRNTIYPFIGAGYFGRSLDVSIISPGQDYRESVDLDSGIAYCLGVGWKFASHIGAELKYIRADWNWIQLSLVCRF